MTEAATTQQEPKEDLVPLRDARKPRDTPMTRSDVEKMRVEMSESLVAELYVIPNLLSGVGYVSADIAEAIKQTHAPTRKPQREQDIWVPHVPRHNHELRQKDETSGPTHKGMPTVLMTRSSNADAERARLYHERKKLKRMLDAASAALEDAPPKEEEDDVPARPVCNAPQPQDRSEDHQDEPFSMHEADDEDCLDADVEEEEDGDE